MSNLPEEPKTKRSSTKDNLEHEEAKTTSTENSEHTELTAEENRISAQEEKKAHMIGELQSPDHEQRHESQEYTTRNKYQESTLDESKMGKKTKFNIKSTSAPYRPTIRTEPELELVEVSQLEGVASATHKLYLTEAAFQNIASHIQWGKNTSRNCNEQGGILLGEVFQNPESNITYGIVKEAVPGTLARGSSAYLEMDHSTWKNMIDHVDRRLEELPEKNIHIIGWYHTHPGNLAVFMSGTDRQTQAMMFRKDWQYALVLNPQRQTWRCFHGHDCKECIAAIVRIKEEHAVRSSTNLERPSEDAIRQNEALKNKELEKRDIPSTEESSHNKKGTRINIYVVILMALVAPILYLLYDGSLILMLRVPYDRHEEYQAKVPATIPPPAINQQKKENMANGIDKISRTEITIPASTDQGGLPSFIEGEKVQDVATSSANDQSKTKKPVTLPINIKSSKALSLHELFYLCSQKGYFINHPWLGIRNCGFYECPNYRDYYFFLCEHCHKT